MKKFKIGSVEILGIIGVILWIVVLFLRRRSLTNHSVYLFIVGMAPNLAAAWISTAVGKLLISLGLKRRMTIKMYFSLCFSIFLFSICSEFIYDRYLGSAFDVYDICVTAVAQVIIFTVPVLLKDKNLNFGKSREKQ